MFLLASVYQRNLQIIYITRNYTPFYQTAAPRTFYQPYSYFKYFPV
ncbi:hypothetical protein NEIELOOT_02650 [Neisseria elongata subsp. glycolytica ATCC 29315]|uniref:Uncharacterized protein n=1 Tax=Neisseria elongata subsp. glycolytica ATCC 29315 TaxID=546263 RepID=D4DU91_NEIEG|nr:hypothetical protein NEIELOOT_02650 [Neisseria elongata subsp. glycolytica ATCC 29315]